MCVQAKKYKKNHKWLSVAFCVNCIKVNWILITFQEIEGKKLIENEFEKIYVTVSKEFFFLRFCVHN